MNLKEKLKGKNKKTTRNLSENLDLKSRFIEEFNIVDLNNSGLIYLNDKFEDYISLPEKSQIKDSISSTSIDLDDKVEDFIDWYFKNIVKGNYTDIGEYRLPIEMKNFIEKMAVWYELRYPDYEIDRLMTSSEPEKSINDVMFRNNPYINDLLDEKSDTKELDWDEFYNANVFIKSLPWNERCIFTNPRYRYIVYLDPNSKNACLYLTKNGIVEKSEDISMWTNGVIKDSELEGIHIRKVYEFFKERCIELPENNELEKTIKNADNWIYQKEEMLNCVMYRIIERGGNGYGPRRAFLFAKEFDRNIDIPMMYGVDRKDPGLRLFINEYIKAGGSKDLKCYIGYFSRTSKKERLNTITIQNLILTQSNNAATFYTPEEDELHQRLVSALASQINQDIVSKKRIRKVKVRRKK